MRVILIEDDEAFRSTLAFALKRRGLTVLESPDAGGALGFDERTVDGIILDMRLGGESGADAIGALRVKWPTARLVVLTGYGSIPEALHTMRLGADDYLLKSASADQIAEALRGSPEGPIRPCPAELPSLARLEWEHIQRVLHESGGNVSRSAEVLGIDRRTLQRKLAKLPPES